MKLPPEPDLHISNDDPPARGVVETMDDGPQITDVGNATVLLPRGLILPEHERELLEPEIRADGRTEAETYVDMIANLDAVHAGFAPTDPDDFYACIDGWSLVTGFDGFPHITGRISGHPGQKQFKADIQSTSAVVAHDLGAGWALTVTGFFRLGVGLGDQTEQSLRKGTTESNERFRWLHN